MDSRTEIKDSNKNRRIGYFIGILSLFVVSVSFILFLSPGQAQQDTGRAAAEKDRTRTQPLTKSEANLYFSDKNNFYLMAETRTLPHTVEPNDFGRAIVQALEKGPTGGLTRTIPQGTRVRAFYIVNGGTAVVDLSESVSENHPGGCKTEILTVYSLVNSLVLNIPEIDSVKILIGGREAMTLAGHVDLRFPFKANMLLIR